MGAPQRERGFIELNATVSIHLTCCENVFGALCTLLIDGMMGSKEPGEMQLLPFRTLAVYEKPFCNAHESRPPCSVLVLQC